MKPECKRCKCWKQGLDIDYVPGYYCDRNKTGKEMEECEVFKEEYTFTDALFELLPGLLFIITLALGLIFMNLLSK